MVILINPPPIPPICPLCGRISKVVTCYWTSVQYGKEEGSEKVWLLECSDCGIIFTDWKEPNLDIELMKKESNLKETDKCWYWDSPRKIH